MECCDVKFIVFYVGILIYVGLLVNPGYGFGLVQNRSGRSSCFVFYIGFFYTIDYFKLCYNMFISSQFKIISIVMNNKTIIVKINNQTNYSLTSKLNL